MYKYIRIQVLGKNEQIIRKKTTKLKTFVKLFGLKLHKRPKHLLQSIYLIDIPEDMFDSCHLENAVRSFCYFQDNVYRLASEQVTMLSNVEND